MFYLLKYMTVNECVLEGDTNSSHLEILSMLSFSFFFFLSLRSLKKATLFFRKRIKIIKYKEKTNMIESKIVSIYCIKESADQNALSENILCSPLSMFPNFVLPFFLSPNDTSIIVNCY